MINMPLQTNTLNIPRNKEVGSVPLAQNALIFKNDPNVLGHKKLNSPSVNQETSLSPRSERLIVSRKETESKGDQEKYGTMAIENMTNQFSPTRNSSDSKGGVTSFFQVE